MKRPLIIAEVKTQSPFGFKSDKSWDELFELANEVGDIISIHTDPRWGGSFDLLRRARALTAKPILAKGIHATDPELEAALEAGANLVLVVGRVPNLSPEKMAKIVIEPFSVAELRGIRVSDKILWNSRDLTNGKFKAETFDEARKIFPGWICQASNIKTVADIRPGADAVLVGEHLQGFARSLRKAFPSSADGRKG